MLSNSSIVYKSLLKEERKVSYPPTQEEVENFWRPFYEDTKVHKENNWINIIKEENKKKEKMPALARKLSAGRDLNAVISIPRE